MNRLPWVICGILLVVLISLTAYLWWAPAPRRTWGGLREVDLKNTEVVPTLDTPLPPGGSALWCASFQIAWGRLKRDVANGPIRLDGMPITVDRLNDAPDLEGVVAPDDICAHAGFTRDGAIKKIRSEMARRFPEEAPPNFEGDAGGAVAFAYMRAEVPFPKPFKDSEKPLEFRSAHGPPVDTRSLTVTPQAGGLWGSAADQVEVLSATRDKAGHDWSNLSAFVIDLCKTSNPYQLLIACVPKKPSLAAMIADMETRISEGPGTHGGKNLTRFDTMQVPQMRFRVTHRFEELEGLKFLNPALEGMPLVMARQRIDFRLDPTGAKLAARTDLAAKASPRRFHADRPYLLLMRHRASGKPILAIWVENAELLEPW
jgi:hypothetical protein